MSHSVVYQSPEADPGLVRHVAFDMDGTIYRGSRLFPYTKSVLETLERLHIGYTYLTNNSSRSVSDYFEKIKKLGLPGSIDNIYTSSSATLDWLRGEYPDLQKIRLLGTDSLKEEFRLHGYTVIDGESEEKPELVLVAFDTNLIYSDLCKTVWWVQQGLPYVATHPDLVCPTDRETVLVDCGAVCALIESITGRKPQAIPGKPSPAMLTGLMKRHQLSPKQMVMVGDRLYTDLEMARRAGVIGVLVLTGEATLETLAASSVRPDFVLDNIATLADILENSH